MQARSTTPTPRTVSVDTARPEPVEAPTADTDAGPLAAQLLSAGHSVLTDLNFATGAAELEEADYASLRALAEFLTGRPGARVVLVGHTDSEGDLDANVALSRRRAAAVAERLVQAYGVNPGQVSADGVGYLSPLAPNDTPEGRKLNRRVEAVLLAVAEAE